MTAVAIHLTNLHTLLGDDLDRTIEFVRSADAKGIDCVSIADHVAVHRDAAPRYPSGVFPALDFPWYEPLTLLAGMATATRRIRLSMGILISPLRPAILLAKQLATLDVLSHGRVDAGFGAGWQREEFDASGIPFDGRFARLEEQILACRALWSGAAASYAGKSVAFDGLHSVPSPAQAGGIPVWLGFTPGPRAFERMARLDCGWVRPGSDPVRLANDIAALRLEFTRQERDPAGVRVRAAVGVVTGPDGRPDIERTLARAPAFAAAGATVLEFYPGRICTRAQDLEPLLDRIAVLRRNP